MVDVGVRIQPSFKFILFTVRTYLRVYLQACFFFLQGNVLSALKIYQSKKVRLQAVWSECRNIDTRRET